MFRKALPVMAVFAGVALAAPCARAQVRRVGNVGTATGFVGGIHAPVVPGAFGTMPFAGTGVTPFFSPLTGLNTNAGFGLGFTQVAPGVGFQSVTPLTNIIGTGGVVPGNALMTNGLFPMANFTANGLVPFQGNLAGPFAQSNGFVPGFNTPFAAGFNNGLGGGFGSTFVRPMTNPGVQFGTFPPTTTVGNVGTAVNPFATTGFGFRPGFPRTFPVSPSFGQTTPQFFFPETAGNTGAAANGFATNGFGFRPGFPPTFPVNPGFGQTTPQFFFPETGGVSRGSVFGRF